MSCYKRARRSPVIAPGALSAIWTAGHGAAWEVNMRQWAMALGFLLAVPAYAAAAPVVLTFEGVGDLAGILNFYNGGADSQGHTGPNVGVSFGAGALGLIDQDAGGTGN